jgi:hypothetical protein
MVQSRNLFKHPFCDRSYRWQETGELFSLDRKIDDLAERADKEGGG